MTELRGKHVLLRAVEPADVPALTAIRATPEVAAWWGPPEQGWLLDEDPELTLLAIVVDDDVAGLIQYEEELDPDYRHANIDLFLDPHVHGRGLGTDAVAALARHLLEDRGHHRLTIDPATDNAAAIRCYEKVGFREVGVMRRYWRDSATGVWRDGLFMELVTPAE
jgi:aminoglycoside 6'-N-acetyltransferase